MMAGTKTLVFVFVVASLFASGSLGARFVSFDASLLLGSDPYSLERLQNINYELALLSLTDLTVHADAVCLQGYYLPYQVLSLQAILSPYLPYSYSATPNTGLCFCNLTEVTALSVCLAQNCSSLTTSSQQLLCGFKCLSEYLPSMSAICQGCVTGQFNGLVAGTTNISTALAQCVYNSYLSDSGSSCVPYGGYSGNVLFSRYPLKNATTQSLVYPLAAHLFNSDAILAVSSFSGLGDVNLVCTQLQPTGPLTTAQAEAISPINGYQTGTLLTLIETAVASSGTQQVVVMGNFKQSPNISAADVEPVNSGFYAQWQNYGYEDLISSTPQCTYCGTNALITSEYLNNSMSSHIFVRGFSSNTNVLSTDSEITLNTTTTILDLTGDHYGQAVTVPYSPNYGVVVEFTTTTTSSAASLTMGSWWLGLLRSATSLVLSA